MKAKHTNTMSGKAKLWKFKKGVFDNNHASGWHLENVCNAEYTICGIAFDGDANSSIVDTIEEKGEGKVTCPNCIRIIKSCKQAKI